MSAGIRDGATRRGRAFYQNDWAPFNTVLQSPVSVPVKDVTEILVSVSPMNDFLDEAVIVTKILIGILVGWYL